MTSTATRKGAGAGPGGAGDRPADASRPSGARMLGLPANIGRGLLHSAATSPGRLSLMAVGLVLLTALTGVFAAVTVQDKKDTINELVDHREPLAAAAQQVYRSLSDADATAASAFLSTGSEPPELRTRYEQNVAQAGVALAKAASDSAGVPKAAEQVTMLGQQIPVYTGLVETARANNRQGFPVGASYLREASELMRAKILPAAQELYRIDTDRLAAEQDDATDFPWLAAILVLGLLAALIAAQVYLTRRTNRVLNVGLVAATAAVVVALLWGASALIVQSALVSDGKDSGSRQVDLLVRSRIAALQARADETLALVARGDVRGYEAEFAALAGQLAGQNGSGGLLREAQSVAAGTGSAVHVDAALRNADAWLRAHAEVRKLDTGGDYQKAVDLAIRREEPNSAAEAFLRLDENLAAGINEGRRVFLRDTVQADQALTLLVPGIAVLAVIAAAGATMGIRERLREYR